MPDEGSDGASVPRILQLLDWELRALCGDAALRPIFDRHDLAYGRGGTLTDKLIADVDLFTALLATGKVEPDYCRAVFEGVYEFGRAHWRFPPEPVRPGEQAP